VKSSQGVKTNSFIPCMQRQWKSRSRRRKGALGYLAEVNHAALSHLRASGLCFCFQTPGEARHKYEELTLSVPKEKPPATQQGGRKGGKARFRCSPWSTEPPIHPCVTWQSPSSNENPSKDLGKQTKLCTDETSSSGKKKKIRLAWQERREPDLLPSQF